VIGTASSWWWATLGALLAVAAAVIVVAMREARRLRSSDPRWADPKEGEMHATIGDEIVVDQSRVGAPPRKGEIREVRGDADDVHYLVRWDDGHESVFFPGSDAHVVNLH
jgi:hypothetical protein